LKPPDRAAGLFRRDAGSVTLETAVIFPVVLLLIWGLLQLGLWLHGRNVCQGAAEEAVRAGAPYGAAEADALDAGYTFAGQAGRGLLHDTHVAVVRTDDQIRATVEADVLTVAPFFPSHIRQTAVLPVERLT
jgi:Flp pilus assembly protein TadG